MVGLNHHRSLARQKLELGIMLDAVASAAAEMSADAVERNYLERLREENRVANSAAVMRYGPGYCGWHVSGQKNWKVF
ncbi:MAG: hypothetical protein OEW23_04335 [Candidatus Aminicenantes bacterium]|nr:hypothetical protein [Candidatus Aminicenantes bacterium]